MSIDAETTRAARATDTRTAERVNDDAVITPRIRTVVKRSLFWIALGIVAAAVIVYMLTRTGGGGSNGVPLDPSNPAPAGAKAVAEVLSAQGVDVELPDGFDAAVSALDGSAETTLALYDPRGLLSPSQLHELSDAADHLVLIEPGFYTLDALAPEVRAAGRSDDVLDAECSSGVASRAGTISGGQSYSIDDAQDASGCFPSDSGGYALIEIHPADATPTTIVGPSELFSNDRVIQGGNAALALGVLGENEHLVWYLPDITDVEADGAPPSLQELTPIWLVPSTLLLLAAAVAAMYWRGRRFGPLIAEDLPVVVRSGETMEGRARLYARNAARLRAIDALRIGAVSRLGGVLGLSRHASVYDIADAAASATGDSRLRIREILVDRIPQNERELMELSDAIAALERAARSAVDPSAPRSS